MPTIKDLLKRRCDLKQGDSVLIDDIRGIYIISQSELKSVVATYENKRPVYKNINTGDMVKIKHVSDGRLFTYAKKHIMWVDSKNKRKIKNET